MTERLLQYIWQFRHFNDGALQTSQQQPIQLIQPGIYNTNQGPDFLNAKIKIDQTLWAGSIEIHINSSDWKAHQHSNDKNYKGNHYGYMSLKNPPAISLRLNDFVEV